MVQSQDIVRALGAIEANLASLTKQVAKDHDDAQQHRERLYHAVNDLGSRLQDVERTSRENKENIALIAPFTSKVRQWEQRGIGALSAAAFVGGLIMAMLGSFWSQIKHLFHVGG